jgi:hypothetical protein
MADTQGLFDALAGAGGANINRPQLNAYIANSQATNGLRSAQTEDALLKAQEMTEQASARGQLEDSLGKLFGPNDQSKAHAATMLMLSGHGGDAKAALEAVNTATLSDPNQLGSPAQTAAQQGNQGKVAEPVALPNNFTTLPGTPPVNPQQSPEGVAQTAATNAMAGLHSAQAAQGGFNPHAAAGGPTLDPGMVDFGGYMLYKTGKMPAMGMGGGQARAAIISRAAQLSQQENPADGSQGQSVSNPGYDTAIANGQDFTGAQRGLNSFAGGPLGNNVRSLNNAVGHLQLMDSLFTSLQNGDTQAVNKLSNAWAKQFGSPAPTNVQAASEVLGPELMKILSNNNSAGTVDERQGFANTVGNLSNAPEQTAGAINTLKGMLGRQGADLALQYHGATGRSDFASRYLQPDVAQYLELGPQAQQVAGPGSLPGSTPAAPTAAPTAAPAPVQIRNDDDYNKLSRGTFYIGPDGQRRQKQ